MRRLGKLGKLGLLGPLGLIGPLRPLGPLGLLGISRLRGLSCLRGLRGLRGPSPLSCPMSLSLLGLLALVALASCSSDSDSFEPRQEPVVEDLQPIRFTSGLLDEQAVTRTGESLSVYATTFRVWGYKNDAYTAPNYTSYQTVIPAYTVNWEDYSAHTTTSNSHGWEYVGQGAGPAEQTIKYWDWGAKAYRFFAMTGTLYDKVGYEAYGADWEAGTNGIYGTYNVSDETYVMTMEADLTSNKAIAAMPYFSSLWFSTGNAVEYPTREFGKPVQLEFMKPCSKVRFIFHYVYPREGILLEDPEFKPTADYEAAEPVGIARKGTVTVTYPLTGAKTQEWYTIVPVTTDSIPAFTEDCDPEDDAKVYYHTDNGWYTVLPNLTQGSYKLKVTVNKGDRTCVVPAEYMHWLPGYCYTYIFKITEEGGVEIELVESAFMSWTEMEGNHTVYNW